jgi:hypothetical protein
LSGSVRRLQPPSDHPPRPPDGCLEAPDGLPKVPDGCLAAAESRLAGGSGGPDLHSGL